MNGPPTPESTPFPKTWELPESIRRRVGREGGRQRAIVEERHLLLILHHVPIANDHQRVAAFFWRNPSGEWRSTELKGKGSVALAAFLKTYQTRLIELEETEENAVSAHDYHSVLECLGPIVRSSRGLHRALQQARELVPDDRDIITFRDQSVQIERTAELLLEDTRFGLDFTIARQAEDQAITARRMAATAHRLNILAALFLPVTALSSVLGMNISSGLPDTPHNFWFIAATGLLAGLLLAWILRRSPSA